MIPKNIDSKYWLLFQNVRFIIKYALLFLFFYLTKKDFWNDLSKLTSQKIFLTILMQHLNNNLRKLVRASTFYAVHLTPIDELHL